MGVLRETTAVALSLWLCACLSASEGGGGDGDGDGDGGPGGDGGDDADAGFVEGAFGPCPEGDVDYWDVAAGLIDDDALVDVVLLRGSLEDDLRGVEVRPGDGPTRCLGTPTLNPRAVHVADFIPGVAEEEIMVLGFDGGNVRHMFVVSGGLEVPNINGVTGTGVEPGHTPYDPYQLHAFDGLQGWQVLYAGPSLALSDGGLPTNESLHTLRDPSGGGISDVLAATLAPTDDGGLRALVVTRTTLYWWDALGVAAEGPINAVEGIPTGVNNVVAAAFADFELDSGMVDSCPDLLLVTEEAPPRAIASDLSCGADDVTLAEVVPFTSAVFGIGDQIVYARTAEMNLEVGREVLIFGYRDSSLFVDGFRDVRFDESGDDPGRECNPNEEDGLVQLCGDGANTLLGGPESEWLRSAEANVDGDLDDEVVYAGDDGLSDCVTLPLTQFIGCAQ